MTAVIGRSGADQALDRAAAYGRRFRRQGRPLHPSASVEALRRAFRRPLLDAPEDGAAVIEDLIAAAEPGLVGNTHPNFFAWVMGGSDPVGVAADWLTSVWGQNAAIYQTAPAAAVAEEAVSDWLLDLLDLPREASVGFVTGATMAGFVCLAAARSEILARAGHDFERDGLQGAPLMRVFLSDDAHASNHAALRHLGFGEANLARIRSDAQGAMETGALADAMARHRGPKIVVTQAGHINSGAFEDFNAVATLARDHGAWLHVDGAFGLWARILAEKAALTAGVEQADSWSVDGHKWLQLPYDSGFAIVRRAETHRRAMDIEAGYLNTAPEDGRNPTEYNPELSRRARGFAAWAVLRSLGRDGARAIVRAHCRAAERFVDALGPTPGLVIANRVDLNQVVLQADGPVAGLSADEAISELARRLNRAGQVFVRTAEWKGRTVLRLSIISAQAAPQHAEALAAEVRGAWARLSAERRSRDG